MCCQNPSFRTRAAASRPRVLDEAVAVRLVIAPVLTAGRERPARAVLQFLLEGLHLGKRLNKDHVGARASYRARG